MKILLTVGELPGAIRESLRTSLTAHGLELPEGALHHAANSVAQRLVTLDENPANKSDDDEQLDFDRDRDSDAPRQV